MNNMEQELPLCACGCDQHVAKPQNKYIFGHVVKVFWRSNSPKVQETREKLRQAGLEWSKTQQWKDKMSESRRKNWRNPEKNAEIRKKMSERKKGIVFSAEHRKHLSEAAKKRHLGKLYGRYVKKQDMLIED